MEDKNLKMSEKELIQKEDTIKEKPSNCWFCNSDQVENWDETDEDIIFKCLHCGRKMPIPFDGGKKTKLYLFC